MNSFRTSLRLKIRFVRFGSERPSDLYDRFQGELLRRKAFLQSRLFSDLNKWKSEASATAFSDLDQIVYSNLICLSWSKWIGRCQIFGNHQCISWGFGRGDWRNAMEEGELRLVLRGLSSLSKGVNSYVIPHFAHASFLVIICPIQVARAHSVSIDRNIRTRLLYGALHP